MRDVLEYFLNTALNFRTANQEKNIISTVDRLPQGQDRPPLFSKKIEATQSLSYLISYEIGFLEKILRFAPNAKVVKLRKTSGEYSAKQAVHEILTESAGVDAGIWSLLPVRLKRNSRHYKNIFSHPAILLRFVKGSLIALKSIHEHGIVHCDLKDDQLCIPFAIKEFNDKKSYLITPDLTQITLIDFGTALWELCPIDHATNPTPFAIPTLWRQNQLDGQDYRGRGLIEVCAMQAEYYHEHRKYDFAKACQAVNCGMDLYSFGYLLKCMMAENLEDSIEQHPSEEHVWQVFFGEYERWTDELMKHEFGLCEPYNKNHLPHDDYIAKVDEWIARVDEVLGYPCEQLTFVVNNTKIIKNIKDKETKLVNGNIGLSPAPLKKSKTMMAIKVMVILFALIGVLFVVMMILLPTNTDSNQTQPAHSTEEVAVASSDVDIMATKTDASEVQEAQETQQTAQTNDKADIALPAPTHAHYTLTAHSVHDSKSGITWRYCPVGQSVEAGRCTGEALHLTHEEVNEKINSLNTQNITLGIQGKWRLPTLKEIDTIKLCNKKMTTLNLNNQQTQISYACEAGSKNTFDAIAFPNIDTTIWSSDKVSQKDLALFDNQDEGYWVVDLSKGSIAKKVAHEQSVALLVLETP